MGGDDRLLLGIDIGGTKLAAGLVAGDGTVRTRLERPTPPAPPGDARRVTDALVALAREALAGAAGGAEAAPASTRILAVGLASAGPLDTVAGTVSPVNIPAWREEPVVAAVAGLVPDRPVVLVNDAVAMTVGECWRGAGRDAGDVLGVVVSTGIGGGLVLEGQPHLGPTGNAGHIGHTVVDLDGEACPCGGRGCVETIASAPSMVRAALAAGWRPDPALVGGTAPDGRALAAAARAGDRIALAAIDRGADALAAGIVSAAALVDLDTVVVGGGFAAAGEVYLAPLRRQVVARTGMAFLRRLTIRPAALGRDAGIVGAARIAAGRSPAGPAPGVPSTPAG